MYTIYRNAYREKTQTVSKKKKKINKSKNNLFVRNQKDNYEPKAKPRGYSSIGQFSWDDPYYRKSSRNWKKHRQFKYKVNKKGA